MDGWVGGLGDGWMDGYITCLCLGQAGAPERLKQNTYAHTLSGTT